MFKQMITRGNDSVLVYNTKLDLRMIYMACPWAETMYHICNEKLQEDFCMAQDHIESFAMNEGDKYILHDSCMLNGVHHYYFRKKKDEKAVDTSFQTWHKIIQEEKERRCC